MIAKQSARLNVNKMFKGIGVSLLASILVTIIGAAVGAWLLSTEKIAMENARFIAVVILLLSSMLGALLAISVIKEKRVPVCLISGTVYILSMLAITALFFDGRYSGVGESAMVVFAGVFSVALLGLKGGKRTNRSRRK